MVWAGLEGPEVVHAVHGFLMAVLLDALVVDDVLFVADGVVVVVIVTGIVAPPGGICKKKPRIIRYGHYQVLK